jgi:hypothetical protein
MTVELKMQRILSLWRSSISLAGSFRTSQDGFFCPELNREGERIEIELGEEDFDLQVMAWAIFKVLHASAKVAFDSKRDELKIGDVEQGRFLEQFRIDKARQDLYELES